MEQLNKIPRYVLASILVSFGGMLFGLDTGTIGPVTAMHRFSRDLGSFSSTVHGFIVSSILIPAAAASFFAGHFADKLGRTKTIAIGGLIFALGTAIESAAMHLAMLIIGRVITGVGEGFFLSTLVVYICEISPARARGLLGSIPQIFITIGLCIGYFSSYGTNNLNSSLSWRLPFALQSFIAFSFAISTFLLLPNSPHWLLSVGRKDEARRTWEMLGVPSDEREKEEKNPQAMEDAEGIHALTPVFSNHGINTQQKGGLLSVFARDVRKRTALGCFLMGMQQLSGIDGVLYYAPLLFQQAGLKSSQASFLASGVSALVIFTVTIPAFFLADRWGRRTSIIWGGLGVAITMILIGSLYASDSVHGSYGAGRWVVIVLIYVFIVIFSITWAVAIKVYASEIQPAKTRAAATSLGQSSNWVVNWMVALTTPIFLAHSSFGAYFLFGFATLFTAIVCIFTMPETKGATFEEIDEAFIQHHIHLPELSQARRLPISCRRFLSSLRLVEE